MSVLKVVSGSVQAFFFAVLIKFFALLKVSFIVGSQCAWFSGVSVIAPLAGAFGGVSNSIATFAARILLGVLFWGVVPFKFLVLYVPGLCASLYWASPGPVVRVLLPVFCIFLFIVHPVGAQAFPYAFFWLIPIVLYGVRRKTIFLEALGSTFVAHAVGSVIWLYTTPMMPAAWLGLIPVVVVERALFASSMAVMYHLLVWVANKIKNTVRETRILIVK